MTYAKYLLSLRGERDELFIKIAAPHTATDKAQILADIEQYDILIQFCKNMQAFIDAGNIYPDAEMLQRP